MNGVTGGLTAVEAVETLPEDADEANKPADVYVHPSGNWVCASNRGHDSVVAFTTAAGGARLRPVEHVGTRGQTPRDVALTPDGSALVAANQRGGGLVTFAIDAGTGELTTRDGRFDAAKPVCVKFRSG